MSSTNRSNARKEHISDYYVTPIPDIELFLEEFRKRVPIDWNQMKIIDCCAGGNEEKIFSLADEIVGFYEIYHPMSYPTAIHNVFGNCNVNTIDIREDSLAATKGDYLTMNVKDYKPEIIITNPPFAIATDIIEKAISDVVDGGYVIMLLRLNFFGSEERKPFFEKYMPEWCFVHRKRMSFVDKKDNIGCVEFNKEDKPKKGSTDSIEYAHFVFRKGIKPDYTKLVVI